jgi:hypothetical protein
VIEDTLELSDEALPLALAIVMIANSKQVGRMDRNEDMHTVCCLQDMSSLLRQSDRSAHQSVEGGRPKRHDQIRP